MNLEYIPLLAVQRDLYRIPRSRERFEAYLATMIGASSDDFELPLMAMNPMGREHVADRLDGWLELDADRVAARTADANQSFGNLERGFKLGLVLADDAKGGWTNRYTTEFSHRFESRALHRRGWIVGMLWTSEEPSVSALREEVLTAIHRAAWIEHKGLAGSLGEMLAQEGHAMAAAASPSPTLESDDLAYTAEVLVPLLSAADRPTQIAALFGDPAARALGYRPLGLSPRAGLAWALDQKRGARSPG